LIFKNQHYYQDSLSKTHLYKDKHNFRGIFGYFGRLLYYWYKSWIVRSIEWMNLWRLA
jgi:hypothetical protein